MKIRNFIIGAILTNCYFLIPDESDRVIVVDPGLDGEGVAQKLCEKGLKPEYVLLTHGHFDHSMGALALQKMGAKLAVHRFDAEMLSDQRKNGALMYFGYPKDGYPHITPDILLEDGDTVSLEEISLRVIHTPGHTAGSVCFDSGEDLFSGDTLFKDGFGRTDLYGGDTSALAASLLALQSLEGDRRLHPGHGSSSTLSKQRDNISRYLQIFGN